MSDSPYLPSIPYESVDGPSLFERWDFGHDVPFEAPLSVRDPAYRDLLQQLFALIRATRNRSLVSVGAGNGVVEAELSDHGWNVLATDCSDAALARCASRGLRIQHFCLCRDKAIGQFDVIYCDGVMGHLWRPESALVSAWTALSELGVNGALAVVSNDLSGSIDRPDFSVRGSSEARFYRPPPGACAKDAISTGLWRIRSTHAYDYWRGGSVRHREILLAQLLMNDRIESDQGAELRL